MEIDVRNIKNGETVYSANKGEVFTFEIKSLWDKIPLVAQPLCFLKYYTTKEEAQELAKKQLQEKINSLGSK